MRFHNPFGRLPPAGGPAYPARLRAGLIIPAAVLVGATGCTAGVAVPPPGADHPANPQAAAAPLPMPSTTLQTGAQEASPPPPMDPHAGHHVHHHQEISQ